MDFTFSEEEEALRDEVRAFIGENFTEEVLADLTTGKRGRGFGPRAGPIFRKIAERGWNAIAWPSEWAWSMAREWLTEKSLASRAATGSPRSQWVKDRNAAQISAWS